MKTAILVLALCFAAPATAMPVCGSGKRVTCVVDGDTFWLGGVKYRLKGVDAPETHGKCRNERRLAKRATNALSGFLGRGEPHLTTYGRGYYGRVLVAVSIGGIDAGEWLIQKRLARRWPDGDKWWCP
ncbi:thermonuclease family protein [uncultured Cohaesibacter sp.]|uniref:thermonuclease family protein n=1 Tax=uncultured Cohaesibacter sp. TaxID=1002546 RepID=UPI002AAA9830|nr:thermonuclease family protein [uncultured Cohaesibacter sp.]